MEADTTELSNRSLDRFGNNLARGGGEKGKGLSAFIEHRGIRHPPPSYRQQWARHPKKNTLIDMGQGMIDLFFYLNMKKSFQITWWNESMEISNSWHSRLELENGTGSARSEVNLVLGRQDLGRELRCLAESPALDAPMRRSLLLDLNLAPNKLHMRPIEEEDQQHGYVRASCVAAGARPPAYIYWNSVPEADLSDAVDTVTKRGETYETTSVLRFRAAERRLTSLSCFASNAVLDRQRGVHLSRAATVSVRYVQCGRTMPWSN